MEKRDTVTKRGIERKDRIQMMLKESMNLREIDGEVVEGLFCEGRACVHAACVTHGACGVTNEEMEGAPQRARLLASKSSQSACLLRRLFLSF